MKYASKEMRSKLTKNLQKKYFRRALVKDYAEGFVWAMSLKLGDIFHGCDSWNHVLKEVKVYWKNYRQNRGFGPRNARYIYDIELIGEDDACHCVGSCAWPAATVNQIVDEWTEYVAWEKEEGEEPSEKMKKIIDAITSGDPICDKDGIKLF